MNKIINESKYGVNEIENLIEKVTELLNRKEKEKENLENKLKEIGFKSQCENLTEDTPAEMVKNILKELSKNNIELEKINFDINKNNLTKQILEKCLSQRKKYSFVIQSEIDKLNSNYNNLLKKDDGNKKHFNIYNFDINQLKKLSKNDIDYISEIFTACVTAAKQQEFVKEEQRKRYEKIIDDEKKISAAENFLNELSNSKNKKDYIKNNFDELCELFLLGVYFKKEKDENKTKKENEKKLENIIASGDEKYINDFIREIEGKISYLRKLAKRYNYELEHLDENNNIYYQLCGKLEQILSLSIKLKYSFNIEDQQKFDDLIFEYHNLKIQLKENEFKRYEFLNYDNKHMAKKENELDKLYNLTNAEEKIFNLKKEHPEIIRVLQCAGEDLYDITIIGDQLQLKSGTKLYIDDFLKINEFLNIYKDQNGKLPSIYFKYGNQISVDGKIIDINELSKYADVANKNNIEINKILSDKKIGNLIYITNFIQKYNIKNADVKKEDDQYILYIGVEHKSGNMETKILSLDNIKILDKWIEQTFSDIPIEQISLNTKKDVKIKSIKKGFFKSNVDKIRNSCAAGSKFKINMDGNFDVIGDVTIPVGLKDMLCAFGKVDGDFKVSNCDIINLNGCPKEVTGDFICTHNKHLTSLEGCPKKIGGMFDCSFCDNLESLKELVLEEVGSFKCQNCAKVKKLDCTIEKVNGEFNISRTDIENLEGCPEYVGGNFDCSDNTKLTNLIGSPEYVGGNYICSGTPITSLEGSPKYVPGDFDCSKCIGLTNLNGSPEEVRGNFICSNCTMLRNMTGIGKVGGKVICKNMESLVSLYGITDVHKIEGDDYNDFFDSIKDNEKVFKH